MTMREVGNSRWWPVVNLATWRGKAFIHAVRRIREGSFVIAAADGLRLAGGVR